MQQLVFQHYEQTREFYRAYGQHKEYSAWAGLLLLLGFESLVLQTKEPLDIHLVATLVVIASALVGQFVANQYHLNHVASAAVAASWLIAQEILSEDSATFNPRKYLERNDPGENQREIIRGVAPKILIDKMKQFEQSLDPYSLRTRILVYVILCLSAIATIVLKCCLLTSNSVPN